MHDVTVQAPEQTQVGVITFSYDAKREFDMNTYSTKDEVLQAVENIEYRVSKRNHERYQICLTSRIQDVRTPNQTAAVVIKLVALLR